MQLLLPFYSSATYEVAISRGARLGAMSIVGWLSELGQRERGDPEKQDIQDLKMAITSYLRCL